MSGVVSEVLSELFENCESELLDELSGIIEGSEKQFFFFTFLLENHQKWPVRNRPKITKKHRVLKSYALSKNC